MSINSKATPDSEFPSPVKPINPSTGRSPDPDLSAAESHLLPNRTWPRFLACSAAVLLMSSMLFLILLFTAFRVKDPIVSLAGFTTTSAANNNNLTNSTVVFAEFKVKNPNAAAFRFGVGETAIYYGETAVGEAATPAGKAAARGAVRVSAAVEIVGEKLKLLSAVSRRTEDVKSGTLIMSCVTRIPGDVKMIGKKHMVIKVKCGANYDYVKKEFTAGDCLQYVIS